LRISVSGFPRTGKTTCCKILSEVFGIIHHEDPFHEHCQLVDPGKSWNEFGVSSKSLTMMSTIAKLQSAYLTENHIVLDRCFLDLMAVLQTSLGDIRKSPVYDSMDVMIHQGLCFEHDLSILIIREPKKFSKSSEKEYQRLLLRNFYTLKSKHYSVIQEVDMPNVEKLNLVDNSGRSPAWDSILKYLRNLREEKW